MSAKIYSVRKSAIIPSRDQSPTAAGDQSPPPSLGLREIKRRETRRAISTCALELSATEGYSNFTLEQLCEKVGISRRTFFNYFDSKHDALLNTGEHVITPAMEAQFLASREPAAVGELSPNLLLDLKTLMVALLMDFPKSKSHFTLVWQAIHRDPKVLELFFTHGQASESQFQELIAKRESLDPHDERAKMSVALIFGFTRQVAHEYYTQDDPSGTFQDVFEERFRSFYELLRSFTAVIPVKS